MVLPLLTRTLSPLLASAGLGTNQYAELLASRTVNGPIAIDVSLAPVTVLTLTGNVTISFSGWIGGRTGSHTLVVQQNGAGGHTAAWAAAVRWPGGAAPTITATASAIDCLTFLTVDAGSTVLGFTSGQDFQ